MYREKVIKGLCEALVVMETHAPKRYWGYSVGAIQDAIVLLRRSFTPKEVYDTVIEHGQHDKRFKFGDKIDYSFSDAVDILNIELMCKAGDM